MRLTMADDVIARDSGGADSKSRQPGHHQRVSEGVSERATRGGAGDASRYSTTRRHPFTPCTTRRRSPAHNSAAAAEAVFVEATITSIEITARY